MVLDGLDCAALAASWRGAEPFGYVVIDDALPAARIATLIRALDDEPAERIVDDIYEVMATAEPPVGAALADFAAELGAPETCATIERISGRRVTRADLRGYAYGPGHFLLPHADWREGSGREVAYALYLATDGPVAGGELELFRATVDAAGAIVATEPAARIAPRAGRLVLFEVGRATLHQVREVLAGTRVSLAGWFYR